MPKVNPEILSWARTSAGIPVEDAAKKLGIAAARGVSGTERLLALENGAQHPSRPLLLKMSKYYRRPLLTFYLSTPPRKGDRGEDFRTVPQQQPGPANALVDALIRDIRSRQSMVRSLLEDAGEAHRLGFVGSANLNVPVLQLVDSLRRKLKIEPAQYFGARSPEEAFAVLRSACESAGIFVLLIGNLGSHHTAIDVDVFRGFALADDVAPFVVVNDQDARTAWGFTVLHECAHLWLGATGVSGLYAESQLERYCNAVASEFLLPQEQLSTLRFGPETTTAQLRDLVSEFARTRNLSATMVAYRLQTSNRIGWNVWLQLRDFFQNQWRKSRDTARAKAREQESGADYYVVRRHRVGNALIDLARRTMAEGLLSPTKAAKVLGVKAMNVHELISQ